ncbi:MAG TPA: hypothetical protein VEX86_10015 [Longimicrobium sp.]|nr:hypothetical protein [Longimicrobium sp.]
MRRSIFAALALLPIATAAAAQPAAPRVTQLDSLARIRVVQHFLEPRTLVGELTAVDSADITVLRGTERLTVPLVYVRHIDLATRRRSPTNGALRGAVWGFLGGATATGLFVLALKAGGSDCDDCIFSPSTSAMVLGLPLTGASTLTGAAVGATRPGDYWVRVPMPIGIRSEGR